MVADVYGDLVTDCHPDPHMPAGCVLPTWKAAGERSSVADAAAA